MDIYKNNLNGTDLSITVTREGFENSSDTDNPLTVNYYNESYEIPKEFTLQRQYIDFYIFPVAAYYYSIGTISKRYSNTISLIYYNLVDADDFSLYIYTDSFHTLCYNYGTLPSTIGTEYYKLQENPTISDNYIKASIPYMRNDDIDKASLWITIPTVSNFSHNITYDSTTKKHIQINKATTETCDIGFPIDNTVSITNESGLGYLLQVFYTMTDWYITITASTYDGQNVNSGVSYNLAYAVYYSEDGENYEQFSADPNNQDSTYSLGSLSSKTSFDIYVPVGLYPYWKVICSGVQLSDTSGENSLYDSNVTFTIYWANNTWTTDDWFSSTTSTETTNKTSGSKNLKYNYVFSKSLPQMSIYFDNRVRGPKNLFYNIKKEIKLGSTTTIANFTTTDAGTMLGPYEYKNQAYRYAWHSKYFLNTETVLLNFDSNYTLAHNKDTSLYTTDAQSHRNSASSKTAYTYILFENTIATDITLKIYCYQQPIGDEAFVHIGSKTSHRKLNICYYSQTESKWIYSNEDFDTSSPIFTLNNLSYKYPIIFGLRMKYTEAGSNKINSSHYIYLKLIASSGTWDSSKTMTGYIMLYPGNVFQEFEDPDD